MPAKPANLTLLQCLDRIDRGIAMRRELLMEGDVATAIPYSQPMLDAVGLFEAAGIGYALVGGIAAMYYGRARFTDDVDFVATTGHQEMLAANSDAMRSFHFDPASTWKLYHESGIDIDIWKDEHSDGIVARAREIELAGRRVRIVDPHDLIAMKLRAGRLQDDYDIAEIISGREPIDDARIVPLVLPEVFLRLAEIRKRAKRT